GRRPGPQPVGQGGEPPGPRRARHPAPRDPRPHRLHRAARGHDRRAPPRRPGRRAAHRHAEEHLLRLRPQPRDRCDRGLRAHAGPALRRRRRAGHRRAHRGRRARVGPGAGRAGRARPRVRPPRHGGAHRGRRGGRVRRARRVRAARPRAAQVDGLGVRRVPRRRVHDAAADPRPDHVHVAGRAVDLVGGRRRLGRDVGRGAPGAAGAVRDRALEGPAADAVGDGPGRPGGPRRHRGDLAGGAQPAPLRRRPRTVRPGQPERGVLRRRPPLRPHRGGRDPGV
ncbi:MAG: Uricase (urate oxidase), partial [uncultured Pseudonocardia sp.]